MRTSRLLFILSIILLLILISIPTSAEDLKIAVTIVPQKQFVNSITNGDSDVVVMIPPGYSPGNYAPRPSELTKLSDAQIYFSMGVPADIQNILPKLNQFNPELKIVDLAKLVAKKYPDRTFANGGRDPHIWLSPKRVIRMVEIMRDEIIKIDPENEELYKNNTGRYIEKIKETDQKIKEILKDKKSSYMLVYHPSFGYFAEEYNLKMVAIEKDGKKAAPKQLQEIIDFAKENNIKRIYHQAEIDSRQTKAIAEEIGAKLIELDPLAGDYLDNLVKMAQIICGDVQNE